MVIVWKSSRTLGRIFSVTLSSSLDRESAAVSINRQYVQFRI